MTAVPAPTPSATPSAATRTTTADLLGIRIAHRMMRRDAHRLADLAAAWHAGRETVTGRRAAAFVTWTDRLCTEIHHHHAVEDDVLWPILERHAGGGIDLAALTDDHAALDPLLDAIRTAAAGAAAGRGAGDLAGALATLAALLDEHIVDEERVVFPVITAYVPLDEWKIVEAAAQKGGAGLGFVLPRIVDNVTDDELAVMKAESGRVLSLLLALVRPGHRRRERLLFG